MEAWRRVRFASATGNHVLERQPSMEPRKGCARQLPSHTPLDWSTSYLLLISYDSLQTMFA